MLALKNELCRTNQIQNVKDSCQISIWMTWKYDMYKYIPTDQLSILLTLIPLHVTWTTTLIYLQTCTAKNSASIFSGILIATYQAILKITNSILSSKQQEKMALKIRAVSSTNVPSIMLFSLVGLGFFVLVWFLSTVGGERTANIKIKVNCNNEPKIPYTKYIRDQCSSNTGQYIPHDVCCSLWLARL